MTSMTGGEAIVSGLVAHGVDTVFGLPGAQIYGLFDAFHQAQLKVIGARHEQACGYMAYGYARSTGRPGVFSVVPGPGVLNAGAALLTAFGSNEPVLCLTGQVPTQFLGQGPRPSARDAGPARDPSNVREMGRPDRISRPCTDGGLARVPGDDVGPAADRRRWKCRGTCSRKLPPSVAAKPFDPFPAPLPDSDRITQAATLIAASKAPMIFVGSGAIHARDEILELAEMIDAPVVAFRSGRGIVSNAHELGADDGGGLQALAQDRPDDRHRHAAGTADDVALAVPARRAEIDPHRHRSRRDAPAWRPTSPW